MIVVLFRFKLTKIWGVKIGWRKVNPYWDLHCLCGTQGAIQKNRKACPGTELTFSDGGARAYCHHSSLSAGFYHRLLRL